MRYTINVSPAQRPAILRQRSEQQREVAHLIERAVREAARRLQVARVVADWQMWQIEEYESHMQVVLDALDGETDPEKLRVTGPGAQRIREIVGE